MHNDIERVLFSSEEIESACKRLGNQINLDYANSEDVICIGLLKGSVPFIADLLKYIDLYLIIDYMDVSSYNGGTESSNEVKILKDLDCAISNKDVIIVEDIVDTGQTLNTVLSIFKHRGAKSVSVVTLFNKPSGRVVSLTPEYIGFEIGNEFIVGYGLDYKELYRNLNYVGILKESIYTD